MPTRRRVCLFAAVSLAWLSAPLSAAAADTSKGINLWQPGDPGQRLHVQGWVRSASGEPVVGAQINIRQADGNGNYHADRYRASLTTDKDGRYGFGSVLPGQYNNVKHIHVTVSHADYELLDTEILFMEDPNLDPRSESERAIFLEDAKVGDETLLYGRFDIVLEPRSGGKPVW